MDPRAETLREGYATVATAYSDHLVDELAGKPLDRAGLTAFAELAPAGRIVDVGCGPGHIAAFLAAAGRRVEGVDLSPAMIAEAAARFGGAATFRVGDMFALPYEPGAIAGIVAAYAIVHVPTVELAGMFARWRALLAPGGLVSVAFHAGDETLHVDELFGCATSLDFVQHRPEAVVAAITAAGFELRARLDRKPYEGVEYPSERTYLLARAMA